VCDEIARIAKEEEGVKQGPPAKAAWQAQQHGASTAIWGRTIRSTIQTADLSMHFSNLQAFVRVAAMQHSALTPLLTTL
jgi:hypothetical protein